VRPLLREPRPQVHYKSQPDATAQRETQKSTNVKSYLSVCAVFFVSYMTDIFDELFHSSATAADDLVLK